MTITGKNNKNIYIYIYVLQLQTSDIRGHSDKKTRYSGKRVLLLGELEGRQVKTLNNG